MYREDVEEETGLSMLILSQRFPNFCEEPVVYGMVMEIEEKQD